MSENVKVKTQNSFKWFWFFHLSQSSLITWLFVERPQVVDMTSDQYVHEHCEVTLSCNATGKPEPNITWTRVWENGTDSGALQSKDGYLVMANISRSSNGTYRCTAFNGIGEPVNQTVTVIVRCKLPRLCNVSFKLIETWLCISLQYQTFFSLAIGTCFPSNLAWFNVSGRYNFSNTEFWKLHRDFNLFPKPW